ncbi:MAG: hypothetical protein RR144_03815 [Clostridia bacterium]
MNITILGLIAIGAFGIFYVVFTWSKDKQNGGQKNSSLIDAKSKSKDNVAAKKTAIADIQRKDMFSFMEFDKIADDMILQEKETKYTMVVQCKGINYDLMSEIEQLSVEEGFITFLNTLKSPIQLYVQARAIDLRTSLDMYKSRVGDINNKYNESTENLKKMTDDINASEKDVREAKTEREKLANISEYAQDITRYIEKLSLNKHMLQRKFYVVLSYYKSEVNTTAEFSKNEIHDICYRELYTRAQSIIGGLQACSVSAKVLNSNELAELLYISYNRDDEKLMDIKTALDSGFYRMYSTSKDIQEKKRDLMQKQIQEEAMSRVEQAIQKAIESGIIKSDDQVIEEFENEADVEAIKILDETNINDEDKRKIQQVIVDKHNVGVDERQKIRDSKIDNQIDEKKEQIEKVDVEKTDADSSDNSNV